MKATVPADRLLVFTVDQGWEPLCKFLGVPAPTMPFPNVNDRAAMKKTLSDVTKAAYGILAAITVAAVALVGGLVWLLGS